MKTLQELLTELNKAKGYEDDMSEADGNSIYECLDCWCKEVVKDEEEEHRWYTFWRYVYEVPDGDDKRYFAVQLPKGKGEDFSWGDIDFELDVDSFYEVFPEQVTTTIYR